MKKEDSIEILCWIIFFDNYFWHFGRYDINRRTLPHKMSQRLLGMISQLGQKQQSWPLKCDYARIIG